MTNDTYLIIAVAVVLSIPGMVALIAYWRSQLDLKAEELMPDSIKAMNVVINDLSNQMRELQTQRRQDHALIIQLSARVELWKEYSRVLVSLLYQKGVADIPPPPVEASHEHVILSIDKAKLQRRISERFSISHR